MQDYTKYNIKFYAIDKYLLFDKFQCLPGRTLKNQKSLLIISQKGKLRDEVIWL